MAAQFGAFCCSYAASPFHNNKSVKFNPAVTFRSLGCLVSFSPQSKQSRSTRLSCICGGGESPSLEWDWSEWSRHFSDIEQAESFASVLKVSLLASSYQSRLLCRRRWEVDEAERNGGGCGRSKRRRSLPALISMGRQSRSATCDEQIGDGAMSRSATVR